MTCALINPRTDLPRVAEKLYRALKSRPCSCEKRWQDGKPDMVTVRECSRCMALADYDAVTEASNAHQS